jgi:hypothetical protein
VRTTRDRLAPWLRAQPPLQAVDLPARQTLIHRTQWRWTAASWIGQYRGPVTTLFILKNRDRGRRVEEENACSAIALSARVACALASSAALAAAPAPPAPPSMQSAGAPATPPPFMRPSVRAVRIEPNEAPTIDGDLSDRVWAKAAIIDNFTQRSPNPYEPATERTVVRILYDENNLYFGFYNYDKNPDQIVIRNMQRDGQVYTSDSVMLYLDPGRTRRNAYNFEIGASGGRTDQLELNNTEELTEWNTIFDARARVVADGWVRGVHDPFQEPVL